MQNKATTIYFKVNGWLGKFSTLRKFIKLQKTRLNYNINFFQ
jgi:hypothetical protein